MTLFVFFFSRVAMNFCHAVIRSRPIACCCGWRIEEACSTLHDDAALIYQVVSLIRGFTLILYHVLKACLKCVVIECGAPVRPDPVVRPDPGGPSGGAAIDGCGADCGIEPPRSRGWADSFTGLGFHTFNSNEKSVFAPSLRFRVWILQFPPKRPRTYPPRSSVRSHRTARLTPQW
jgi:hypothetical protein